MIQNIRLKKNSCIPISKQKNTKKKSETDIKSATKKMSHWDHKFYFNHTIFGVKHII